MRLIVDPVSLTQTNHVAAAREEEDDTDDSGSSKTISVQPANFSGPEHFQPLLGQCFQFEDEK